MPSFFDCLISEKNYVFNFFEDLFFVSSISKTFGNKKFVVLDNSHWVCLAQEDSSFVFSDALKIASYVLAFFNPQMIGVFFLFGLGIKALNHYSYSYQIVVSTKPVNIVLQSNSTKSLVPAAIPNVTEKPSIISIIAERLSISIKNVEPDWSKLLQQITSPKEALALEEFAQHIRKKTGINRLRDKEKVKYLYKKQWEAAKEIARLRILILKEGLNVHDIYSPELYCGIRGFLDKRIDPVKQFPKRIIYSIFSFLKDVELERCLSVNKEWRALASDEALWKKFQPHPTMVFGKEAWNTYFGDIGEEPPLPKGICKILESPCPVYKDKKVKDTHVFFLVPETVNGKPLDLKTLGDLVKSPRKGNATHYAKVLTLPFFSFDFKKVEVWDAAPLARKYGNISSKAHWVLMTKNILPKSGGKSYTAQKAIVAKLAKKARVIYEIPGILDIVVGLFMKYVSSKVLLLRDDNKGEYGTRCQDEIGSLGEFISVSAFSMPSGLGLGWFHPAVREHHLGVVAVRKFY